MDMDTERIRVLLVDDDEDDEDDETNDVVVPDDEAAESVNDRAGCRFALVAFTQNQTRGRYVQ